MVFKKVNAFLENDIDEGHILIDTYLYKESSYNLVKEFTTNTPPVNSAPIESSMEIPEYTSSRVVLSPSQ